LTRTAAGPIGLVLCRILDADFRELPFF
jgi:hypothetical protein